MTTKIKANNISAGSITADLLHTTAITDKLGFTPVSTSQLQAVSDTANTANSNASSGSSAKFFGFTLSEDKTELIMEYGTEDYNAQDYLTWTVSPTNTFIITNNNLVNQL
jgi:hypothetical protein